METFSLASANPLYSLFQLRWGTTLASCVVPRHLSDRGWPTTGPRGLSPDLQLDLDLDLSPFWELNTEQVSLSHLWRAKRGLVDLELSAGQRQPEQCRRPRINSAEENYTGEDSWFLQDVS